MACICSNCFLLSLGCVCFFLSIEKYGAKIWTQVAWSKSGRTSEALLTKCQQGHLWWWPSTWGFCQGYPGSMFQPVLIRDDLGDNFRFAKKTILANFVDSFSSKFLTNYIVGGAFPQSILKKSARLSNWDHFPRDRGRVIMIQIFETNA